MDDFFQERDIESNIKKLKDLFNIISLTRKYKVIGSSHLKNIRYNSDYDLDSFYENSTPSTNKVVKYFQFIFKTLNSKKSNSYITDFKCGLNSDGEPLKWTKEEVKKNKKELLDGSYITLNQAIQQKSNIKIDVMLFVDGTFIEITESYFIKIGGISNFNESKTDLKKIIESIQQSEMNEVKDKSYNKALKRNFSWRLAKNKDDKKLKILLDFFNSSVGILNKARSDLDILITLLEKNIPVNIKQILSALDNIKFQQSYNTIHDFTDLFLKLMKIKSKKMLYVPLVHLREKIYKVVNDLSKEFYIKNFSK
nr:MAG: hypothetical protein [Lake Baikal virophage 5]WPF46546.1 MAG: hypothetical protein [Lake Baikal virophage 5]